MLKTKLKIPTTQLIQASEIIELEKEKETLNDELSNCKAKLMKFVEEKREWEKQRVMLRDNVKALKQKQAKLEKEVNEKGKESEVQIIPPPTQSNEESIVQEMSNFSLRDLEIVGLKNQNKNLENANLKKEEESKATKNKCKYLLDKNDKLMKQLTRQIPVQVAKHIILDMNIAEA